ncbi:MAG: urease accessory protein UreH domain-containing protein [Gammaproteobacteria bacterium]
MSIKNHKFSIAGMQCGDCENVIEDAVRSLPGVSEVKADFSTESVSLVFDNKILGLQTVCAAIKDAGYECRGFKPLRGPGFFKRLGLIAAGLIGIVGLLQLQHWIESDLSIEDMSAKVNYALLFAVGALTSLHCIGMCGGFVLSYTTGSGRSGKVSFINHFAYGAGKTLGYSGFGALFGALGGIVSFSLAMRSAAAGLAGIFLIVYGLSMLETFAGLRRLHIRLPHIFWRFVVSLRQRINSPFVIGMLNSLMLACGPLQAMYIMAAGSGNAAQGALMLATFALGTLPMMFAFGYFANIISVNSTQKLLRASGLLILFLGVLMINRALMISGSGYDFNSLSARAGEILATRWATWKHGLDAGAHLQNGYQIIYMEVEAQAYVPNKFTLKKNVPVKWIINVKELSPCNKTIVIPSMQRSIKLHPGLQLIELLPGQDGVISWSCSMGMIPGSFVVKK